MQQDKQPATNSGQIYSTLKIAAGATAAGLLMIFSKPIIAYTARELCYQANSVPSFWANPLAYTWTGATRLYSCEWVGHWGFNWFDVFTMLSNSWQAIAASLGSVGGLYALSKTFQNRNARSDQKDTNLNDQESNSLSKEELEALLTNLRKGHFILNPESSSPSKPNLFTLEREPDMASQEPPYENITLENEVVKMDL